MQVGNGTVTFDGTVIVLNDQSTPTLMTPDFSATGCTDCDNLGVSGFYDYTQSTTWSTTNATYSLNTSSWNSTGVLGSDVVCLATLNFGALFETPGLCLTTPIYVVDTISVTNAAAEFEWAMQGSLAFGRPSDTTSMSFLNLAVQANLTNSTTWSYSPSSADWTNPGVITVGGYNESDAMMSMINWVPTPVVSATPDAWLAPI
jgi:hypothetical protein